MFLPENSYFPPVEYNYLFNKWKEYQAWYSGDPEILLMYYLNKVNNHYDNETYWQQLVKQHESSNAVRLPVASDIAQTSSNLLFSEVPNLKYEKKNKSGEVINEFIEENGFYNFLLESAELASALGGCYLKIDIDKRLSKLPIVSVLNQTQAFPTFLRGRLFECLIYRVVKQDDSKDEVYRLFENRRRNGSNLEIEYKLYKGSNSRTGKVIDLNSIEETANLELNSISLNNIDGLGIIYVPNIKPNKLIPGSNFGDNDFGVAVGMMDSLDLAWNSWIRDIELGMGQIFVDEELLVKEEQSIFGDNKTVLNKFSKFEKCFINLNLSNYKMSGDNVKPLEISQFEMRVEEHYKSCNYFHSSTVSLCGYSPSTFGLDTDGRAESGTALRIRERKSFLTREKKARYWTQAVKQLLLQVQKFYIATFDISYLVQEINVELEDSIIVDQAELSNTLKNLDQARAISTYMKIKLQHNDWSEKDIEEEMKRIFDEEGQTSNSEILNDEPIDLDSVKENNENNNKDKDNNNV